MTEHLGDIKASAKPSSDQGLTFEDDSGIDSDSGLEDLIEHESEIEYESEIGA